MSTPVTRLLGIMLLVLTFGDSALGDGLEQPCVPPVWTQSPARCTFDIYGFVFDSEGEPVANARLLSGVYVARTSSSGFFDLFTQQAGYYDVIIEVPQPSTCFKAEVVQVPLADALIHGGVRHDFVLDCI